MTVIERVLRLSVLHLTIKISYLLSFNSYLT